MKKTSIFFIILLFSCFFIKYLQAESVGLETAIRVGVNIYAERADIRTSDIQVVEVITEIENSENLFYIFNIKDHGFVIVAADDAAVPVLGYVFNHNYTTENHPPQFDAMLASYKDQILYLKQNNYVPSQETVNEWNRLNVANDVFIPENYRAVGPLLSTTWNQGQFYNESCPPDAGSIPGATGTPQNGYVWAGCTATATAQVMKYHAHPATGEGSHSYTHATYGVQSANFAATNYNWAAMPNNVTAVTPAVHTLLYHVGVGAEMNYGLYGSGAWIGGAHPATALSALQDYFKYDPNSYYDQRNNYSSTPSVWHAMLKTELDNNRPLVYEGYNSGYSDGHAFVIDGYSGPTNDNYHVNFGWSGLYDGYYTLDAIAPSLPSYDYRFFQAALFGVEPRKWKALPDVSIDVSQMPYTGVDLDNYYEGPTLIGYSVATDLSTEEFALTINANNQLVFSENPTVTSDVNIDITIRATYTGGTADDTFNFIITGTGGSGSTVKWEQLPDLSPTGMDVDATHQPNNPPPILLADDFQCTETGYITDIHIWGSWLNDYIPFDQDPAAVQFTFSIHADIPASQSPTGYSMPGDVLWIKTWQPTPDDVEMVYQGPEDWYNPFEGWWMNDNHNLCYKYNYILDPADYYLQEGTIDNPIVYWLDVQATPLDEDISCRFGWKTSLDHWNDDAVWVYAVEPYNGPDPWNELIYPDGHEFQNESIDLAFQITTEGEPPEEYDFGDAPDPTYPTLIANDGARHVLDAQTYLGAQIDAEPDGWQSADALGDDNNNLDDEDGVIFTSGLMPGQMATVDVTASTNGYLNAWVDFDTDGSWSQPYDQIFTDVPLGPGTTTLSYLVKGWPSGCTTYARFRFSSYPGLSYTGLATDGEVEDYKILIEDDLSIKWIQYPDLSEFGMDVHATADLEGVQPKHILADDWQCDESGYITDIHFWGSWLNDYMPYADDPSAVQFILSIHQDIPVGGGVNYSRPGDILWSTIWQPTYDDVEWIPDVLEDWYDPEPPLFYDNNHQHCFKYNLYLDESEYFYQEGTPDEPVIYWLAIQAIPQDQNAYFGWKTREVPPHFMDNATWTIGDAPYYGPWNELGYPYDHIYYGQPIDLAFALTSDYEPVDLDYGDAQDPNYPTLLVNDGARHVLDGQTYLGAQIDAEPDGQPTPNAVGDDINIFYPGVAYPPGDEDGVTFNSVLVQGNTALITVNASVNGYLNAWADFDNNGDWTGANEQIYTDKQVFSGNNSLTFSVPASAVAGPCNLRFRFNSTGGLSYKGLANDGEVEDYQVIVHEPIEDVKMHFPQWPDPTGWDVCCTEPNLIADDWQCSESGPVTDIHFWVSWFTGDGSPALIDSIHISIHKDIPAGVSAPWSMPGTLLWERNFYPDEFSYEELWGQGWQGWYDPLEGFNVQNDHEYFDLINITEIPDPYYQEEGTIYWLDVRIYIDPEYSSYKLGWKTSQHHFMDNAVYFVDGVWLPLWDPITQERLDMAFAITGSEPSYELDFGDAPDPAGASMYPTLLANNGARHVVDYTTFLGDTIDAEPDGQPNTPATGDDNNILYAGVPDDEDGVTFTSILVPGYTAYVTVRASVDGMLNAWIDFNGDGNWADATEHIFNDLSIAAGDNYLSYTVPAGAQRGSTYARFRFNINGGLSYDGSATEGEVEDYLVEIYSDIEDSKMHYPQWPDPTGWDIKFNPPNVIADDWQCIESGPVTDVHFWISFQGDYLPDPFPGIDSIHLSIHEDYEVYPGYYTPYYQSVWERNFYPNDFTISGPFYGNEGWFDYENWQYITNDHTQFFRIDIENIEEPFVQCQESIYWLDIYVALNDPDLYQVGWKTSGVEQFRMNAMYGWYHLGGNYEWDPISDPITEESLDMAFVITGQPGELDFGDAPDPAGAMMYPTTLASNGARHIIDYVTFLGDSIDAELDGWQSSDALGDDTHDTDDEDGVTFNSGLIAGGSTNITVVASVDGILNAWVDFNCDYDWADAGEQIFTNTNLIAGANTLTFNVPAGATIDTTCARFRFDLAGNLNYEGLACRGEVEDYMVVIEEALDYGDAPDPFYPTLKASNGARHILSSTYLGAMIDGEADGWQSSDALGDDTHGFPDEDGIVFKPIIKGSPAQIMVTTSDSAYLQGWMDFNQDGDWSDPGEQIFTNTFIHFGYTVCLNYYVPADADTGYTFARFRYSTTPNLTVTGLAQDGEVEDYKVEVIDSSDVKWSQLPCEELPGLHCHDEFSNVYNENIIADDWLCNGGVVTDIHWWGNYEQVGLGIDHFHLSIHLNDPTGCIPLDPEIWGVDVPFADVNETWTGLYDSEGNKIYVYTYYLNEPFYQEEGQTYWLDISAYTVDPYNPQNTALWRWQESARSTSPILCTAAYKSTYNPIWSPIDWSTPPPTRYSDMAFEITSEELPTKDFGDAPDSYKTLLASNGARHTVDYSVYLGKLIDTETDGIPTLTALGDDNTNLDDEDGVIFTTLAHPGDTLIFYVKPSVDGFLHAWFDFDVNGDFIGSSEHVLNSANITGGICNYFSLVLPATMPAGTSYARFRYTTTDTSLSYNGPASDGEVEDYRLFVTEPIEDLKMHYPQWPDIDTTGIDVRLSQMVLADDWQCSETGYVSDIHFWASFESDILPDCGPENLPFIINIYDNIPVGPNQLFSKPGELLWTGWADPYWYTCTQITDNNPEGWFDPSNQSYIPNNHLQCYQYDIIIPEGPFVQEKDSVYWISIQEYAPNRNYSIGWKSTDTLHHFMDDAVYWLDDDWAPLEYPSGHIWADHTLDLSFAITGEPADLDLGDAPNSYKTKVVSNGARHVITMYNPMLGDTIDAEPDGQPAVDALGDDQNILYAGVPYPPGDEDGVVFPANLVQNSTGSVIVTIKNGGYLNGWIDFNNDGDFDEADEHVIDDSLYYSHTMDTLTFAVPASAAVGTTYARFRISWDYDLDYYGIAYDGEVEDYTVEIEEEVIPLDYGDAPDPSYPTLLASDGARHALDGVTYLGAQIDAEPDGWQSISALGDDNHNLDDEDGVVFTCPLIPGEQGAFTVTTNSTGRAFLNCWIDYNANGTWTDANEHVIIDQNIYSGIHPFNFNIPAGAAVGYTYARFRLSTVPGLPDYGFAPDGEVEDYRIKIIEKPDDDCKMHYHQWPDTTWYGMDVRATEPLILADDFLCTDNGLINSIHIWGSWFFDEMIPPPFEITIWSDNPQGPQGYSQPELLLWSRLFNPGEYTEFLYNQVPDGEWWYDPLQYIVLPMADFNIWQYDFSIPDDEAFVQEQGTIYWLGIKVLGVPPDLGFGWKTSVNHWNDDAVWGLDGTTWNELRYPDDHPFHPFSIDFAFYIDCEPTAPIVNISADNDSICVTWDPVPCAHTYTVYSSTDPYATFPTGWTVEATGITATSWCENVSGLTKKFYKVVAVK